MPKSILLCNMSAKYLSDYISHPDWMEKGYEDIYLSGSILAEVLPRFEAAPPAPAVPDEGSPALLEGAEAPSALIPLYVPTLDAPVAPALTDRGETAWASMSREEALDFRNSVAEHNRKFLGWCRTPLGRALTFTDRQLEIVQRVLKYYSPRSEADKAKDADKQKKPRPELPANEFTLQLLRAFNLTIAL